MNSILFFTPYYAPDIGPSAPVFTTLCEGLVKRGHDVTCITTLPHYSQDMHQQSGFLPRVVKELRGGVHLIRLGMPIKRGGGVINRLMHQLWFNVASLLVSLPLRKRNICIFDGPVLWSGLPWLYWHVLRRHPYFYNQHDIFPDVAWKLGWLKRGVIFWLWDAVERIIYMRSKSVFILGNSAKQIVMAKGVPAEKLEVVPILVDFQALDGSGEGVDFKEKWGLQNKFVVFYGGNIGHSQRILELAKLALAMRDRVGIHFVIVGEGDEKPPLERFIADNMLDNISLFPFQDRCLLFDMYRSFDCGIVPLSPEISSEIVPSKAIFMMGAGMPLLIWGGGESELSLIVIEAHCGVVVSGGQGDLAAAIVSMALEPTRLRDYAVAARSYAEMYFSAPQVINKVSQLCQI